MTGFDEASEIKIKLPATAKKMGDLVNHVGKCLRESLSNYPDKNAGRRRWITTGQLDFRPGGSACYFVSYEENTGFSKQ